MRAGNCSHFVTTRQARLRTKLTPQRTTDRKKWFHLKKGQRARGATGLSKARRAGAWELHSPPIKGSHKSSISMQYKRDIHWLQKFHTEGEAPRDGIWPTGMSQMVGAGALEWVMALSKVKE
ncbi:Adhesion G-Protein Coupled Receptor G1 [Manis pentadactyla]|nr:Adhesion G-Protein Coupled Receptor G1 [Manis pentadactyla]